MPHCSASTSESRSSRGATRRRARPPAFEKTPRESGQLLGAGNVSVTTNPTRMAETTETPLWNESEPAKVESWRLHILLEAGYPVHLAERIAGSVGDVHQACELVSQGGEATLLGETL